MGRHKRTLKACKDPLPPKFNVEGPGVVQDSFRSTPTTNPKAQRPNIKLGSARAAATTSKVVQDCFLQQYGEKGADSLARGFALAHGRLLQGT